MCEETARAEGYGEFSPETREFLDKNGEQPILVVSIIQQQYKERMAFETFNYKRASESCILSSVNGKICMLCVDDNVVPADLGCYKATEWGKYSEWKYAVYISTAACGLRMFRFKSLLMAISFAHKKFKLPRRCRSFHCIDFVESKCYQILKPVLTILADDEYNQFVSAKPKTFLGMKPVLASEEYPNSPTDDALYREFKRLMLGVLQRGGKSQSSWAKSSSCVGTLETLPGEEFLLRANKRLIDPDYVKECVKTNGFPALVTRIPKCGNVTTSGHTRSIYAMNILYEWVLRYVFGNAKVECEYRIAKGRDFGDEPGFCYDVIECDRECVGYLARFAKDCGMPWLVPRVHDPLTTGDNTVSYINQMPSGIFHTTIVNVAYVAALLRVNGVKRAVIQGDGFMVFEEKDFPGCRKTQDFNGFIYKGGQWCYSRGHRINEFKYLRGAGPKGKMRYAITSWAYKELGAEFEEKNMDCELETESGMCSCGLYCWRGKHFNRLNDWEKCHVINVLYSDVGRIVKLVMEEKCPNSYDLRRNGWDCVKSVKEEFCSRELPLLFPRDRIYIE